MDKKDAGPYLQWTSDHSREFRKLLRSYMATLDARLRLSLAAINEIGPSASARQASGPATTAHVNSMDAFHSPADANLFAITLDSCSDTWADPAQSFAKSQFPMLFLGPCFSEAANIWFASGAFVIISYWLLTGRLILCSCWAFVCVVGKGDLHHVTCKFGFMMWCRCCACVAVVWMHCMWRT